MGGGAGGGMGGGDMGGGSSIPMMQPGDQSSGGGGTAGGGGMDWMGMLQGGQKSGGGWDPYKTNEGGSAGNDMFNKAVSNYTYGIVQFQKHKGEQLPRPAQLPESGPLVQANQQAGGSNIMDILQRIYAT